MEQETLYTLAEQALNQHGARTAFLVRQNGRLTPVSGLEWRRGVNEISAFLLSVLGLKQGDRIVTLCDNRFEWSQIAFGINLIGCVDVPRGADASDADIKHIVPHSAARVMILENAAIALRTATLSDALPAPETVLLIDDDAGARTELARAFPKARIASLAEAQNAGRIALARGADAELVERGRSIQSTDLAAIIYTSGTTAAPKGVMLEHGSFYFMTRAALAALPIGPHDRTVLFLPPWHIAERVLEITLLCAGAAMACSSLTRLAADLAEVKPTALVSVPRVWEQLHKRIEDGLRKKPGAVRALFGFAFALAAAARRLQDFAFDLRVRGPDEARPHGPLRFLAALAAPFLFAAAAPFRPLLGAALRPLGGRVRFAISGAGALPLDAALFFRTLGLPIVDAYGLTETTGPSAIGRLPFPRIGSIGAPLPGVEFDIRDAEGRSIREPGVKGVLFHRGRHVMRGYYRDPEKTALAIQDGWFNSGDLFVWTRHGEARYAGRAKDTIVLAGGENVEPEPIEMRLKASPLVQLAVVIGQDRKGLAALIVPAWERCMEELAARGQTAPGDRNRWDAAPEVRALFQDAIRTLVSPQYGFKSFERITAFKILGREFEKGRELTESMKVKRLSVAELYAGEIETLYGRDSRREALK